MIRFLIFSIIITILICCQSVHDRETKTGQSASQSEGVSEPDTALFSTALNGNLEMLDKLLNGGTNVNLADKKNRTALMYAAYNGHTDLVKLLIEKGADINLHDVNGRTPLMFAASGPFAETIKLLLENGADPNMADFQEHYTALMYAAAEGQAEVVRILLEHHADPMLKDADSDMALTFARNNGHPEVVKILETYAKINEK